MDSSKFVIKKTKKLYMIKKIYRYIECGIRNFSRNEDVMKIDG